MLTNMLTYRFSSYLLIALSIGLLIAFIPAAKDDDAKDYSGFYEILNEKGINTKLVFDSLLLDVMGHETLPSWEVRRVKLIKNHSFYYVKSHAGTIADLQRWAQQRHYFVNVDHNGIALVKSIEKLPVVKEAKLMNVSAVSAYVLDAMSFAFPSKPKPVFEEDVEHGNKSFYTRNMKIPVKGYSFRDLVDLGTLLDGLPVSFSFADLQVSSRNGVSGEMTLSIVGGL